MKVKSFVLASAAAALFVSGAALTAGAESETQITKTTMKTEMTVKS